MWYTSMGNFPDVNNLSQKSFLYTQERLVFTIFYNFSMQFFTIFFNQKLEESKGKSIIKSLINLHFWSIPLATKTVSNYKVGKILTHTTWMKGVCWESARYHSDIDGLSILGTPENPLKCQKSTLLGYIRSKRAYGCVHHMCQGGACAKQT